MCSLCIKNPLSRLSVKIFTILNPCVRMSGSSAHRTADYFHITLHTLTFCGEQWTILSLLPAQHPAATPDHRREAGTRGGRGEARQRPEDG